MRLQIIGYSETEIIVNDPYRGDKKYYPRSAFEADWEAMGSQAVAVSLSK